VSGRNYTTASVPWCGLVATPDPTTDGDEQLQGRGSSAMNCRHSNRHPMAEKKADNNGAMMVPDDDTEAAFLATALALPTRPGRYA